MGSVDVTWWGHSTVSVRDSGTHVLTDPVLTRRVVHLDRRRGQPPEGLAPDAVVISHLHHDHLHLPSLRRLPTGTPVVVPVGAARLLAPLELDVRAVELGERVQLGSIEVQAVFAAHDGRRHPGSSWSSTALGYVLHGSVRTWFVGDTGPDEALGADVGTADVVLAPVGGWGPPSRSSVRGQHLGPGEAAAVVASVQASMAVPIHYGTLWPSGMREPASFGSAGQSFVDQCAQGALLAPGESATWASSAS